MNTAAVILGAAGGMTATNIGIAVKNARSANGYRKAREDDHHRALATFDPDPVEDAPADASAGADTGAVEDIAEEVALAIEPIIGLRAWAINPSGFLTSHGDYFWQARVAATARCDRYAGMPRTLRPPNETSHAAPGKTCTCGFYAAKRELEIQYGIGDGPFAWGRVALWGRVEEAEKGFRAQFAYPVSLTIVNCKRLERATAYGLTPGLDEYTAEEMETLRDQLALHYGIPVRIGALAELDQARRDNYEAMGIPAEIKELVG